MSSLYSISVPVMLDILTATKTVLTKGGEHARSTGAPISEYLGARIYEDMFPLRTQVFIVCNTARKAVERLTGAAPPGDLGGDAQKERSFEELLAAVDDTAALLKGVAPESVDGKERLRGPCELGPRKFDVDVVDYIRGYSIPTGKSVPRNMQTQINRHRPLPLLCRKRLD